MSFSFTVETNETDGALVKLTGEIDEMVDFSGLEIPKDQNRITIDLKEITMLNSVGLRSWVLWIKSIEQDVIVLRHCPNVAVHQMNILEGFMPLKTIVESFEVPYNCESCGEDTLTWAKRGEQYFERTADKADWIKIAENIECQNCGKEAELDVIPTKYFHFLKSRN